ncbi:MAG: UvrD-helicase domain-containing protein [Bacteroidia bacterium]|nr:UvrD-helicase domain-containing protein [Bacteroidia bacterium]
MPRSTPTDPDQFVAGLNPQQRAAVLHGTGPAMIIAGAGSGKTRVLTHRLAYLLATGAADAFELLALTFTNKAAREMRARIEQLVGPESRNIPMGTFHSLFSRILRIYAEKVDYTPNFTIYDTEDSRSLIKTILKELRLDDKKYKPNHIHGTISNAKNYLVTPAEFAQKYATDHMSEVAAKVYHTYQSRLVAADAMDFDDLLVNMVALFQRAPEVQHKLAHRYRYIMVDEYQDTNHAQYIITRKLSAVHENVTVVGDDAQSIYSFRGANIENILNFQKDYPDAAVYKLEQNYRSTGIIVDVANAVIAQNKHQIPKVVFTENPRGELIHVLEAASDQDEAQRVVDRIREQKFGRQLLNKEFAILYRTNAQSRVLEDQLRRAGIVYRIFGGLSFYKRKEVKDVVAYLRLAINPRDEEALVRVINYPARGIGDTSIDRVRVAAHEGGLGFWEALQRAEELGVGRTGGVIRQFVLLVKSFGAVAAKENAYAAVEHIAKHSGILKELHRDNSTEGLSRWENVQELINAAREFADDNRRDDHSLAAFLAEIALFTDADEKSATDDYVSLMTIHAAKGLEYKSVFVVGLEEGLFPGQMAMQDRADLEEERRLFYVAVTRAREALTLSWAKQRFRYGQLQFGEQSRFLEEIDPQYLKLPPAPRVQHLESLKEARADLRQPLAQRTPTPAAPRSPQSPYRTQPTPAPRTSSAPLNPLEGDDLTDLCEGMQVEHFKFGRGVVTGVDGAGEGRRAHIRFEHRGDKTLLLRYAKLKIVG